CGTGIYASGCTVSLNNSGTNTTTTPTSTVNGGSIYGYWGSNCKQVSLHGAAVAGMLVRTNGRSPSSGIQLYNRDANNLALSYNTNCWIYGLKGLTSIVVSNGTGPDLTNSVWYQGGAVLITSKHAVTVDHLGFGTNVFVTNGITNFYPTVLRFIGKSGAHYTATVTNQTTIRS